MAASLRFFKGVFPGRMRVTHRRGKLFNLFSDRSLRRFQGIQIDGLAMWAFMPGIFQSKIMALYSLPASYSFFPFSTAFSPL